MASYLVTGGGGFIGSNLAEALLGHGHTVRVLDNFATGRRSNLESAPAWAESGGGAFELLEGDMREADTCHAAMRGVDYVLHFAAIPSVQRSVENPAETNAVNVSGTLNLLDAARAAQVKRFVFASSSSIYGESETLPKEESMPSAPISPYGLQKLAGETYCCLYHRLYGLPTVALRYFNVFGPRQDPGSEYSAVIPRFIEALRAGRPATIYGDGEQTRDFTFVANVVAANLAACEAPQRALGRAFNIACGERVSLNRLLARLAELHGAEPGAVHEPPRAGDIRHSLAAIERAQEDLSYRPLVELDEGLRRTVEAW
ncbi:MAG: SDR family oxidoreductase [bacterium]|nr:SDR family oxidoreductase [bacterium]